MRPPKVLYSVVPRDYSMTEGVRIYMESAQQSTNSISYVVVDYFLCAAHGVPWDVHNTI